mgnify:CR=1 FL=1
MDDIFIRYVELPLSVRAFTCLDDNGDFNIYANSRLSYELIQEALTHEVTHIKCGHFHSSMSIRAIEMEADKKLIFG